MQKPIIIHKTTFKPYKVKSILFEESCFVVEGGRRIPFDKAHVADTKKLLNYITD